MKKIGLRAIFWISLIGLLFVVAYSIYICFLPIPGEHSYMGARLYILVNYPHIWILSIITAAAVVFSHCFLEEIKRDERWEKAKKETARQSEIMALKWRRDDAEEGKRYE